MRAHVLISGMVQGVGLRFYIKDKANELGITGWVKNKKDGKVEAVLQRLSGWPHVEEDKAKIEELIELCRKGTALAEVKHVDVKWDHFYDDLMTEFEIR